MMGNHYHGPPQYNNAINHHLTIFYLVMYTLVNRLDTKQHHKMAHSDVSSKESLPAPGTDV